MSLMTLTHKIPEAPLVISPREGEIVDMDAVLIAWEPVTNPAGIEIDTYQLQLFPADPPEEQDFNDLNIDFTSEVPPTVTEVKFPPSSLCRVSNTNSRF